MSVLGWVDIDCGCFGPFDDMFIDRWESFPEKVVATIKMRIMNAFLHISTEWL